MAGGISKPNRETRGLGRSIAEAIGPLVKAKRSLDVEMVARGTVGDGASRKGFGLLGSPHIALWVFKRTLEGLLQHDVSKMSYREIPKLSLVDILGADLAFISGVIMLRASDGWRMATCGLETLRALRDQKPPTKSIPRHKVKRKIERVLQSALNQICPDIRCAAGMPDPVEDHSADILICLDHAMSDGVLSRILQVSLATGGVALIRRSDPIPELFLNGFTTLVRMNGGLLYPTPDETKTSYLVVRKN